MKLEIGDDDEDTVARKLYEYYHHHAGPEWEKLEPGSQVTTWEDIKRTLPPIAVGWKAIARAFVQKR
jgi:myo-inositol catabolism protein IolC